jgi:hypothetical protein
MDLTIKVGREFHDLARRLRDAGAKGIQDELQRAIEKKAEPIAEAQRKSVKALPARGKRHTGLRTRVAREVRIQVQTTGASVGVKIVVGQTTELGNLPAYMNAGFWRHPVFGNKKAWVTQQVPPGWFDRPAKAGAKKVQEGLEEAMQEIANKIAHGGI